MNGSSTPKERDDGEPSAKLVKKERDDDELSAKRVKKERDDSELSAKRVKKEHDDGEPSAKRVKTNKHAATAGESRRLHIGNLKYVITEAELKDFFKGYLVESITMPMNPRTNRAVGYAFVDLSTPSEAERAITELSGKHILDRKVSVQFARKPEAKTGATSGESGTEGGALPRTAVDPTSYEYDASLKVFIGPSAIPFYVHGGRVSADPPFFEDQAGPRHIGQSGPSDIKEVRLPRVDTTTFNNLMEWVYTQRVPFEDYPTTRISDEGNHAYWLPIVTLYVLATKIAATRLMNDIVDRMIQIHFHSVQVSMPWNFSVRFAYELLPVDSPLLQLLPDWAVAIHRDTVRVENEGLLRDDFGRVFMKDCPEFALDILYRLAGDPNPDDAKVNQGPCYYHKHTEGPAKDGECKYLEGKKLERERHTKA